MSAWDSVIAGMKKPPEEKVLKDILLYGLATSL